MRRLTFTNARGESVTFGNSGPFLLTKLEGAGAVGTDIQTQKAPYQDGVTYLDAVLEPRQLALEGAIMKRTGTEIFESRRKLASVFNPKLGPGLLKYEYDGGVKVIEAIADGSPVFPDRAGKPIQKFLINLICPDPYWKSPQISEEPTFEPLFQFPFEGEFQLGIQRERRTIINDGDAPAPLYIEFFGPAVNPLIRNNTTGEYIKVNQELREGEVMKIDTTPGRKSVYFVGPDGEERNVFNWIDLGSTFFQLVIGENDIEYTADSDIQGAIVNISYNKLYVAV